MVSFTLNSGRDGESMVLIMRC